MIGKKYIYKIYSSSGTYITTWRDVSPPMPSFKINSGVSELVIKLARKFYDFGEGNDVAIGNELKLFVSDKEAPAGVQIYSGELTKYHLITGEKDEVEVTFLGYVFELARRIVVDGSGNTTLNYSTEDPSHVIKDVIDKVGSKVTYSTTSIEDTGLSVTYSVVQNTALEVLQRMVELAPANWYWYLNVDNVLHFHNFDASSIRKFYIGKHINKLEVTKTGEDVVNQYFFLGGGSPQLYKKYVRADSITQYGTKDIREQDERITLAATALEKATSYLDNYDHPQMCVSCTVIDSNIDHLNGVDIEQLRPGDAIQILHPGVKTTTTRWDVGIWDIDVWDFNIKTALGQTMRLEDIHYFGTGATLKLGVLIPTVEKAIVKNTILLENFRVKDSPVAPT